jgi:hypothetical protein
MLQTGQACEWTLRNIYSCVNPGPSAGRLRRLQERWTGRQGPGPWGMVFSGLSVSFYSCRLRLTELENSHVHTFSGDQAERPKQWLDCHCFGSARRGLQPASHGLQGVYPGPTL